MARWPRLAATAPRPVQAVTVLWQRAHQVEEDLRLYRNLLALLPYCVRTRRVVFVHPPPAPTSVVYFKPTRQDRGRHLGWN